MRGILNKISLAVCGREERSNLCRNLNCERELTIQISNQVDTATCTPWVSNAPYRVSKFKNSVRVRALSIGHACGATNRYKKETAWEAYVTGTSNVA